MVLLKEIKIRIGARLLWKRTKNGIEWTVRPGKSISAPLSYGGSDSYRQSDFLYVF